MTSTEHDPRRTNARRARIGLLLVSAAVVGLLLVWGVADLPDFGHYRAPYGDVLARVAVPQRKATDIVASVTFDYRGIDTLGEEFILFAAATGTAVLLRGLRERRKPDEEAEQDEQRGSRTSDAVRALGTALTAPTVVLGVYIVTHGHLTPGGGFQGGIILAGALLLVYAAGQFRILRRASPLPLVETAEAVGAAGFALLAVGGLIFGIAALYNFLPKGTESSLLSAGIIPLAEIAVGIEVAGALALVFSEFLYQPLLMRGGEGE